MKYIVFLDGNQWCATMQDFVNLQESLAGFGNNPSEAIAKLMDQEMVRLGLATDALAAFDKLNTPPAPLQSQGGNEAVDGNEAEEGKTT